MREILVILLALFNFSASSQEVSKEDKDKIYNKIKEIKSEYQPTEPSTVVKQDSAAKVVMLCRTTLTKIDKPLVIVDGKEIPFDQLKSVDTSKIASIDILKDDEVTALFGTRAIYGVIMVTTFKCCKARNSHPSIYSCITIKGTWL
jgi:TonB-dependent SusC/RagA subfamily outer membrane receptor